MILLIGSYLDMAHLLICCIGIRYVKSTVHHFQRANLIKFHYKCLNEWRLTIIICDASVGVYSSSISTASPSPPPPYHPRWQWLFIRMWENARKQGWMSFIARFVPSRNELTDKIGASCCPNLLPARVVGGLVDPWPRGRSEDDWSIIIAGNDL